MPSVQVPSSLTDPQWWKPPSLHQRSFPAPCSGAPEVVRLGAMPHPGRGLRGAGVPQKVDGHTRGCQGGWECQRVADRRPPSQKSWFLSQKRRAVPPSWPCCSDTEPKWRPRTVTGWRLWGSLLNMATPRLWRYLSNTVRRKHFSHASCALSLRYLLGRRLFVVPFLLPPPIHQGGMWTLRPATETQFYMTQPDRGTWTVWSCCFGMVLTQTWPAMPTNCPSTGRRTRGTYCESQSESVNIPQPTLTHSECTCTLRFLAEINKKQNIPFSWVCTQFDETIDRIMNLAAPHSLAVLPLSSTKSLLFVTVYHCFSTPITGPKLKLHSNERCSTMSGFLLRFSSPFVSCLQKLKRRSHQLLQSLEDSHPTHNKESNPSVGPGPHPLGSWRRTGWVPAIAHPDRTWCQCLVGRSHLW